MKFRIHIKADTDDEVREELRQAAFILTGLREATKECMRGYKTDAVKKKQLFEEKADEWVNRHKVFYKS